MSYGSNWRQRIRRYNRYEIHPERCPRCGRPWMSIVPVDGWQINRVSELSTGRQWYARCKYKHSEWQAESVLIGPAV